MMTFGPGPLSSALKALIGANVAVFLAGSVLEWSSITWLPATLGLRPSAVAHLEIWRLGTYMFLHAGLFHLLFNMLALWMFGTELERIWGTPYFLKFYFVTGIGAGVLTVVASLVFSSLWYQTIIGASGAIYGLLLAYGPMFPDRPIYMYFVFPIPAKYFVMLMGAIEFYSTLNDNNGVASLTHLGGLVVAYLFLKGGRIHPLSEAKYWYLRWKMARTRKKFDVYSGGRANDWNRRVH